MPTDGIPTAEPAMGPAPPIDRQELVERALDDTLAEILQPRCTS